MTNYEIKRNSVTEADAYRVFFNELSSHSPSRLIRKASEFFGMPVLLTNEHYQLICLYPEHEIGNDVFDSLYREHILSTDIITSYQDEYLNIESKVYDPFYADTGTVGDCPRIFGEVYSGGKIYGHFAIMMFDQPLQEEDIKCAVVLQKALTIVMDTSFRQNRNTYSDYLRTLIDPETTPALRTFAVNELNKVITGNFTVFVTSIINGAAAHARAAMLNEKTSTQFYSALSTIYNDNLVVLFGTMQSDEYYTDNEQDFLKRIAQQHLSIGPSGVSRPFSNMNELEQHYLEAMLCSGTTDHNPNYFADTILLAMYRTMFKERHAEIFVHPAITKMRAFDEEHSTDYLITLRTYLRTYLSKDKTAQRLHIHRNSLNYRLQRIEELFGITLDNPTQCIFLLHSFELEEGLRREANISKI